MQRAFAAFFIAPTLVSLGFGVFAVIALPVMLGVTMAVAMPLFLGLRRLGWLNWWHAIAGGAFCGLLFAVFYLASSSTPHVELYGPRNALFFIGIGAITGLVFWWLGLFRNRSFGHLPATFPKGMLVLVPIIPVAVAAHEAFDTRMSEGRAQPMLSQTQLDLERDRKILVRLTDGTTVIAKAGPHLVLPALENVCVTMSTRLSATLFSRLYFVHGPKRGSSYNDC